MTTVQMTHSVGEHVAGEVAELSEETADRFILLGWAVGNLSREFSDEERAAAGENVQVVSL